MKEHVYRSMAVFSLALTASVAGTAETMYWNPSVSDGVYAEADNWQGGVVPQDSDLGVVGAVGAEAKYSVVLRPAAGGTEETSATTFLLSDGQSVTLDARGGRWVKKGSSVAWQTARAFNFIAGSTVDTAHFFNLEDFNNGAAYTMVDLDNVRFSVSRPDAARVDILTDAPAGETGVLRFPSGAKMLVFAGGSTQVSTDWTVSTNVTVKLPADIRMRGRKARSLNVLRLKGNAVCDAQSVYSMDSIYHTGTCATNLIACTEDSRLNVAGSVLFASVNNSTSSRDALSVLRIEDAATVSIAGNLELVRGANYSGRLELLGGTLGLRSIYGSAAADCRSSILFDGGVLRPTSTGTFLYNVKDVRVGSNGLTVNVRQEITATLNQTLANAEGESGVLTKTGPGTLAVACDSAIASAVVVAGTLRLDAAVTAFADAVSVAGGGTLDVRGSYTTGCLSLGSVSSPGCLSLAEGAVVTVAETDGLTLSEGSFVRLAGGTVGTAVPVLRLRNGPVGLLVLDASGTPAAVTVGEPDAEGWITVSATCVAAPAPVDGTWNGSVSSDWSENGNWDSSAPPSVTGTAVLPAEAARRTVTASADLVGGIAVTGGDYAISGILGLVGAGVIPVSVASGATLDVTGAVVTPGGSDATVRKTGSGRLALSGPCEGLSGAVSLNGGTLALGNTGLLPGTGLTLRNGTLEVPANRSALVSRDLESDPGVDGITVFNTAGDLTLCGFVDVKTGGLAKRGAGTLTFDLPAGTSYFSREGGLSNYKAEPSGAVVFPVSGDSPASIAAFHGLNVFEGVLRIRGTAASQVEQIWSSVIIGGNYGADEAVIEVDGASWKQTASSLKIWFAHKATAGAPVKPTLRVINGANVFFNTVYLTAPSSFEAYPEIVVSNATFRWDWQLNMETQAGVSRFRAVNSRLLFDRGMGYDWFVNSGNPLTMNMKSEFHVTGGDVDFGQHGGKCCWYCGSFAKARFDGGATLHVAAMRPRGGSSLEFDDATLSFFAPTNSGARGVSASFLVGAGGMRVEVPVREKTGTTYAIDTHMLSMPFTGEGRVTKIGAGELVVTEARTYGDDSFGLSACTPSGAAVLRHAGGTEVAEGRLTLHAGAAAADHAIRVDEGATLDLAGDTVAFGSVGGSGVVANGRLGAAYACSISDVGNDCLAFDGVSASAPVEVRLVADADFDWNCLRHVTRKIATLSGSSSSLLFKGAKVNDDWRVVVSVSGNEVFAELASRSGVFVILR